MGLGLLRGVRYRRGRGLTPSPRGGCPPAGLARLPSRLTAILLALGLLSGCLREPPPPTDPELAEALGLPASTPVHRVVLTGQGESTRVLPREIRVRAGDLVQFVALDRRVYAVRFELGAMSPEMQEFLRSTQQEGSPPLATEGARFVLSLQQAPAGRYPFTVEGYGEGVPGAVVVDPPD
jgi:plastocyanin